MDEQIQAGQIQVAKTGIDFEAQSIFTLSYVATDDGTPVASTTATVTISIKDVNENPKMLDVSLSEYIFPILIFMVLQEKFCPVASHDAVARPQILESNFQWIVRLKQKTL